MEAFLFPIATFAFVTSITPGPNNIMLASSGVRFGFTRTFPHLFGVVAGFALLTALCGLGIGALLIAVPAIELLLKIAGTAYLLYFAWQLRNSVVSSAEVDGEPMSFGAAVLFQFANPKAWMMAVTGAAAFMPDLQPYWVSVLLLVALFAGINLPCTASWALLGSLLRRFLHDPAWQRAFNGCMVLLTIYSAAAIWH